jgi:hypothetical protein
VLPLVERKAKLAKLLARGAASTSAPTRTAPWRSDTARQAARAPTAHWALAASLKRAKARSVLMLLNFLTAAAVAIRRTTA